MIKGTCECCEKDNIHIDKVKILLPIGLGEYDFREVYICWDCVRAVLYPAMDKFLEINRGKNNG